MARERVEVTSADIARIAEVKPTAVSNWRRRHDDFPQPVGGTDRSPRFDLAQVEAWLRGQGKTAVIPAGQRLWQAFDSVRGVMAPDDALGMVGLLLLHLRQHPGVDLPASREGFSRLMQEAEHSFVAGRGVGAGVTDLAARALPFEYGARQLHLLSAAAEAAAADGPAQTFDTLCSRLLEGGPRAGFAATPPGLAQLMVELAGPAEGTMLDLACGSGTLLLAGAEHGYTRVHGQELYPALARLAALRLAFRNAAEAPVSFDIRTNDALRQPEYARGRAAAAVCNPPFAERNWGYDELTHSPSWEYGVPARPESELAWLQQALAHVRHDGAVVMLLPPAVAARPSGRRIRAELLRRGALRAVVSLPPGAAAHYALALQLWVLKRPGQDAPAQRLLMVDAAGREAAGPWRADDAGWATVRGLVMEAWTDFTADPDGFGEREGPASWGGVARAVPVIDLLDEEVDLSPRRHLPLPTVPGISRAQLISKHQRLSAILSELIRQLPEVPSPPTLAPTVVADARTATLDELAKSGALFLRRAAPTAAGRGAEEVAENLIEGRVLTAGDVLRGQTPSKVDQIPADELRNPPIRQGDVLIPTLGDRMVARVATADDAGAYLSPTVYLARVDPSVLDPWFVAGYLSSSDGSRQAERLTSTLGASTRFEPRRVRVPLLPLDTQRAYGDEFRRLAEFNRTLSAAHDLGQQLVRDATDAITAELSGVGDGPCALSFAAEPVRAT